MENYSHTYHPLLLLLAGIAIVLPLLCFLFINLFKLKQTKFIHGFSITCQTLSFIAGAVLAGILHTNNWQLNYNPIWFSIGSKAVAFNFWIDLPAVSMLALVSFISLMVQLFSLDYMKGDKGYARYYAQLSLFTFAMMAMLCVRNIFVLYVFWELIGFCSYLLIGFWHHKPSAIQANKKAFIVNRIGDVGFIIGIALLYAQFNTFDLSLMHASAKEATLGWAGFCLFIGVLAKSAQFPLHVWLPDAMEGPTPVSALIHAATMVVAGVYLLFRISFLLSEDVLIYIAFTGAFTAFMAATFALTQYDIKKVLAFSTISQLGFMVMAVGVGSTSAAFFHILTHAFFKCLLFICAGVIIHALKHQFEKQNHTSDPQDMRNMGGLRKYLPFTFIAYTIAALALTGQPFFSGFLSKDAILTQAYDWSQRQSNPVFSLVPILAFSTVFITAFYIARQYFLVFFGEVKPNVGKEKLNESIYAKIPMFLLALASFFLIFSANPFSADASWMQTVTGSLPAHSLKVSVAAVLLSACGIYLAYLFYYKQSFRKIADDTFVYRFLDNQWYIDKAYNYLFVNPVVYIARFVSVFDKKIIDGLIHSLASLWLFLTKVFHWIDTKWVDGFVNGTATFTKYLGVLVRMPQTGRIQAYFTFSLLAILILVLVRYIIY